MKHNRMKPIFATALLSLFLACGGPASACCACLADDSGWPMLRLRPPAGIDAQNRPTFDTVNDYLNGGPKGLTTLSKALKAASLTSAVGVMNGTLFLPNDAVRSRNGGSV
jgi:hypothetical protein